MFQYNEESQSYSFSLFGETETAKRVDPNLQEIVLLSDFKILQEAEFHDVWFCEHEYCENTFWFGGKHHCRICGNTICSDHCMENVVLSTRSLPVLIDKLPNATRPILAASTDNLPETLEFKRACLKCYDRAKIKSPEELQHEKEERRTKKAERKRNESENLERYLLSQVLQPELSSDMEFIKVDFTTNVCKSSALSVNSNSVSKVPVESNNIHSGALPSDSLVEVEHTTGTPPTAVTTTTTHSISAATSVSSAAATEPVAVLGSLEETSASPASSSIPTPPTATTTADSVTALSAREDTSSPPPTAHTDLCGSLSAERDTTSSDTTGLPHQLTNKTLVVPDNPAKKILVVPEKSTNKALELLEQAAAQLKSAQVLHDFVLQEKEKRRNFPNSTTSTTSPETSNLEHYDTNDKITVVNQKEAELAKMQNSTSANIVAMLMKRNRQIEQEENQAIINQQAVAMANALSNTTVLMFKAGRKRNVFRTAQATNDETAIQAAAADIIAHAWRAYVADRRRRALQQRRRVFLERISACRIQSWIRVKLAHLQFIARRRLREAIAEAEAQALVAQQAAMIQIRRLSRVFLAYFAKRRLRQRLYELPRVVVVDKIAVGVSYASQQVIVSRQSGCAGIESLAGSARNAVVARSKAAVLFKTKEDVFASNTVCHERCLLTGVTADSTLCVTLLNPTSFVQSLVSVRDHMSKLSSGRTVTVSPLPVETVLAPTLDSSGASVILPKLGTTPDDHPGLRYLTLKAAPYVSSHAGYVFKQTQSIKGDFKERYLVLLEGKLCFFKDALSLHEPKGSLLCTSIKSFKFGHDKSSEGKLTVFLSDGKEEWHLRFSNTDRPTSSVECRTWLRKIQYACPQTRLNGCTELGFVELLERMGRAEDAPVLRPSTQGKVLTSVFGSFHWRK